MSDSLAIDIAIVGGGSAGCVLAPRLAEQGSRSVLLIDAGPDLRGSVTDIHAAAIEAFVAVGCRPSTITTRPTPSVSRASR